MNYFENKEFVEVNNKIKRSDMSIAIENYEENCTILRRFNWIMIEIN